MIDAAELLHDPRALRDADTAGLLPAAGTAGAQVRALADPLAALGPAERPRALVLVGAGADDAAALVAALQGGAATTPVLAATAVPGWIGALDVVVVLAAERRDPLAQQAAGLAARRGATVVVRADAAGLAELPRVHPVAVPLAVSESLAAPARLALAVAVARWCGALPGGPVDVEPWALALDALALACHPSTDGFVNPAVTLADHLLGTRPLLVGADPVGDVLTRVAAQALAELAGVVAGTLDHGRAALSPAVLRSAAERRDIFADPDDGGDRLSLTVLQGPLAAVPAAGRTIAAALPDALVLPADPSAGRAPGEPYPPGGGETGSRPGPADADEERSGPVAEPSDPVAEVLVAVSRWSFAAVYLGLTVRPQPVPLDHPDGLGRIGTALGAVREVPRPAERPADDDDGEREPLGW